MFKEQDKELTTEPTDSTRVSDTEVKPEPPRRRFPADEKKRILDEVDNCVEPGDVGSILRREGIYSSYLTRWREERDAGLLDGKAQRKRGRKAKTQEQNQEELAQLRAENQRLLQRLQKAEAIIEIQKKVSILLGLEETIS